MELLFEWLLIITLVGGLSYFIFDSMRIFKDFGLLILNLIILIGCGFFIGIGVHLANITFGW
jgi:hypothetical protein